MFGVEPDALLVEPGMFPQGDPLGVVLGFVVEGCVVLPGVVEFGEVDPGEVVFGVELEPGVVEPGLVDPGVDPGLDPGLVVCPGVVCGVAVPAGGVAVLAGGVAGEPGVELCPALLPEPPAGAAPPGELWATAQLAQPNTTESNISFRDDISNASRRFEYSSFQANFLTDNPWSWKSLSSQYAHARVEGLSGVCLRYG